MTVCTSVCPSIKYVMKLNSVIDEKSEFLVFSSHNPLDHLVCLYNLLYFICLRLLAYEIKHAFGYVVVHGFSTTPGRQLKRNIEIDLLLSHATMATYFENFYLYSSL